MRYDIAAVRAVAIIAIVLHHSIIAFGGWPPNVEHGVHLTPTLGYISTFCKVFGLGLFTYISGYLMSLQRHRYNSFGRFAIKKARRILLPAVVFSLLYWLIFPNQINPASFPAAINGTHLWYLPTLFCCMMICYLIKPTLSIRGISVAVIADFCCLVYALKVINSPMTICIYLIPFTVGYLHNSLATKYIAIGGGILATAAFICLIIRPYIPFGNLVTFTWANPVMLVGFPMCAMYAATCHIHRPLPKIWSLIDRHSFHIYLVHQFVINTLLLNFYFKSNPRLAATIMFTVTFATSLLASISWGRICTVVKDMNLRGIPSGDNQAKKSCQKRQK